MTGLKRGLRVKPAMTGRKRAYCIRPDEKCENAGVCNTPLRTIKIKERAKNISPLQKNVT
ncbi:MAG: hypothetical protein LBN27_02320 [Prevotellaceae bacterium]|nr:hypothetical protein [Prevotellaceae bacterium]